ncbi:lipoprotein-releasing ABC transporter permease subunit [Taylorella equigenitalis]|uniref:lipoprotein-releasing ABC transporter permease subunit n=1 Tax=Taylorella equigenitalis TaxID=29575 RepID=UPI0005D2B7F9|nr:lipoprotein-releasing ABC transporter permease subunit [Taylorella equigenitalis]WDU57100.1 lipoprotein-releasing ABC transporter permease subunit [Taylorella equigenitalis]
MVSLPYELWVGTRYAGLTKSKGRGAKRDRFVSFVAASSMAGIALGVAALIIVLSVMSGFQVKVRDRMLSVIPHIQVYSTNTNAVEGLKGWEQLRDQIIKFKDVTGASPFVSAGGMLVRDQVLRGAQFRGILPSEEGNVSELPEQITEGSLEQLKPKSFGIVLGSRAANLLGVGVGDTLLVMSPQGTINPSGFSPRMRQVTVVALFDSGHAEYDSNLAFMHADDVAVLFRNTAISGVRVRVKDMLKAPEIAELMTNTLPTGYIAHDWTYDNRTWFAAVKVEKRMMFMILTLIVAVAAFNLLSSLVMSVKDKQSDIAILRTLGASPRSIGLIFLIQGALIGIIGSLVGVALGCLIAYNIETIIPFIENLLGIEFINPEVYFISQLPSQVNLNEVFFIATTSIILSLLATIYPSWRASKLQPAEVLRHE